MATRQLVVILSLVLSLNLYGQATFKTMFYNLLDFPFQEPITRVQNLEYILNSYQPDLFMVCELNDESGADRILETIQRSYRPSMAMATFYYNTSDNYVQFQNMMFYDSKKFSLESQDIIQTLYRDFNRYTFKLNALDQTTNPVILDVFVCHLKASRDDEPIRALMIDDLEEYLDSPSNGINSNSNVILAGDFNVYSSSEAAIQKLIDNNNIIQFVDPANRLGSWSNNSSYLDVFTQSTRDQSDLGGATGGFDDRFDFILTSDNMQSNPNLSYVPDSYQVYGNNNNPNCFNQEINSTNCSGSEFDYDLRNNLYLFSDHLPVTVELQTNKTLASDYFLSQNAIVFLKGNIVNSTLTLGVNNNLMHFNKIYIYNTLGQKIRTIAINNSKTITINVSSLANGIYFIKVNGKNHKSLKFIKTI